LVLAANRQAGYRLLTCSIRPAGIIGEGDVQVIPRMLDVYKTGKTGFQLGENENLFDFTYVGNVAHSHLLAASALMATAAGSNTIPLSHERVDGEAFFITNDSPVYFWDFPRMVWKAAGSPLGTEHVWTISKDLGLGLASVMEWVMWGIRKTPSLTRRQVRYSCMTRYYDISKAKRRLGYRPLYSLEEGIERAVKWFLEQEAESELKKTQ
jgi:sterol-4alpha-carboxylate 3-dehydrogenase (decarboxylating)